jgi:hypothetical protein
MASRGRGRYNKRREPVSNKNAPSIAADEMVKPAAGERKTPEISGAFEAGEDKEEDVVRQVRQSMGH